MALIVKLIIPVSIKKMNLYPLHLHKYIIHARIARERLKMAERTDGRCRLL
jgi:hypothetical protein